MFQTPPTTLTIATQDIWAVFQQQRRICSQYIQLAREGNYYQEALRMRQSNELMDRLSKREKVKDLSQWDVFSTRDSVVLEQEGSFNLSALSNDSRSRTITRKNGLVTRSLRDIETGLQEALTEIQHNCNSQTVGIVKRLADEYRKLRGKAQENEKKERCARASQKLLQELQEKNLVLTNKLDDHEQQLSKLRNQITQLRNENKDLSDTIFKRDHQINSEKKIKLYEEIASAKTPYLTPTKSQQKTSITILTKVFAQKEKILSSRYQQIRTVEGKVEALLFSDNEEPKIKKVKESIKLYKTYLQHQSQAFQRFVDQFREQILESQTIE